MELSVNTSKNVMLLSFVIFILQLIVLGIILYGVSISNYEIFGVSLGSECILTAESFYLYVFFGRR
jgi:hypothetical protein